MFLFTAYWFSKAKFFKGKYNIKAKLVFLGGRGGSLRVVVPTQKPSIEGNVYFLELHNIIHYNSFFY